MELQTVVPSRSPRSATDPVHYVDKIVPIRELPAIIGEALKKDAIRDHLVAIGIGSRGERAHVIVLPASAKDENVSFLSDEFAYVVELSPFGEMLAGKPVGGVRALRVAGKADLPVMDALRPTLEAYGPAFMDATRGYLSAPPVDACWMMGPKGHPIHVQRASGSFNLQPRLTFGACDGRFAVAAMDAELFLVNSSRRADRNPMFPEWPEPRLQPVCMDDVGSHLSHQATHVSAALWPGKTRKTNPAARPPRWYHLVQGAGKTTVVSIGADMPGHCATFRSEGQVVHNRFARIAFLNALGDGLFLTRDTATGMVRPLRLEEMAFLPREVNQLVRSF